MKTEVILKPASELCWSFTENRDPYFQIDEGGYKSNVYVDPFPAYAHDIELVKSELERCVSIFSIDQDVKIYVLEREFLHRTNAQASQCSDYNSPYDEEKKQYSKWEGVIVMSGKRIPPHPAVTRYLVAHEYSHVIQYNLADKGVITLDEYAELRGYEQVNKHYGGGTWHTAINEIFADDCRMLKFRAELEFWPHTCPRPEEIPAIVDFWSKI